ncbi:MAG: PTS sugar transporter subunit IIA [Kiritimatiellae bacterium]|nr:PTS sugar transporter subunit IIA [Kiritimatiellia bacterium]
MKKNQAPAKLSLHLSSFLSADNVLIHQEGLTRDDLIRKMLKQIAAAHGIHTEEYYQAVIDRERVVDTVVANGIAIPHARVDKLDRPYVSLATTRDGIVFADDKPPVHLIMLVLIPTDQPALYLQFLKAVSVIAHGENAANRIAALTTPEEVFRYFERGGTVLPDYVCATDIMNTQFDFLRKNDSLKAAIDCFISKQISEIPVLDRDGDMIGIVSAKALLKVCLPDYLLWMDDLSPIINFQPFANVLRNEENTWLSDILSEEFASVQMSDPAISVASQMTNRNVSTCYVLNGKKLIGIIRLPQFLNKIFRE